MSLQLALHAGVQDIDESAWDALLPWPQPFLRWRFLAGLERHHSLQRRFGWQSRPLTLQQGDRLLAAAPLYLKDNSHGEFVFDHGWAEAYRRHRQDYYPKLLVGIPYTPVSGPRLLAGEPPLEDHRQTLLQGLIACCDRLQASSCHINFHAGTLQHAGAPWLHRHDIQFHWCNPGWGDFEQFLAALQPKKRKNIRQERRQLAAAGVRTQRLSGAAIEPAHLQLAYRCYLDTFTRKGNLPVLSEAFFQHLGQQMADQLLLALAWRGGAAIAAALFLFDAGCLYGRYWGALEAIPGLHFELCYYQGIEFCLERGIGRFEPGAQGEHKIARGFLPVRTHSLHYIADPRFRAAIADSLQEEARWLDGYQQALGRHSPYRQAA